MRPRAAMINRAKLIICAGDVNPPVGSGGGGTLASPPTYGSTDFRHAPSVPGETKILVFFSRHTIVNLTITQTPDNSDFIPPRILLYIILLCSRGGEIEMGIWGPERNRIRIKGHFFCFLKRWIIDSSGANPFLNIVREGERQREKVGRYIIYIVTNNTKRKRKKGS